MSRTRLLVVAVVAGLVVLGLWLDVHNLVTLENFRARQDELALWVSDNYLLATAGYFIIYIVFTAANIPGASVMSLVAGALFGTLVGSVLVSFASSIGAVFAFLFARYLLREVIEKRFRTVVERVNRGIDRDGSYFLLTLRLIPIFPYFMINLVMGLTRMKLTTFYWVSQVGMLPATILYVNAGTQISRIESLGDVLSPEVLGSFVLLGLFPLVAKKAVGFYTMRKHQKQFDKPENFDTNMVVIGAGSAGLVTSYIAAAAGAKVTLVEKHRMGGDCLNTGCVPSKALIRSSRIRSYLDRSAEFGIETVAVGVNFPAVMQRVREVIARIEPHDSVDRYTSLGVDCVQGKATITSPWTVDIDGRMITTQNIVIAAGGSPAIPPIPGIDEVDYVTSDTLWHLERLPRRLLVLGGGAIGCELAQAFKRLGSDVMQVEMLPRLLANEDPEVSAAVEAAFRRDGIYVLTNCRAKEFQHIDGENLLLCEDAQGQQHIKFDTVLVATGRRGNTEDLGLETLGIEANRNGTIPVNEYLQTDYPNIYVCGDAAGPYQLTHAAAHQAWYCAMNALFGRLWKFAADYSVIPRAVFCDPEVASVGISEQQAIKENIPHEVTTYGIDDLDRAIADGEAHGFVRVITPPGSDKILGVTIVGAHAGDIISEYVLAMRHGLGLSKILGTVHIYPTLAEANKFAAGNWRKANLDERLLRISKWFVRRGLKL